MKKYTAIVIIGVTIVLGFFVGFYIYKINQIDENNLKVAEKTVEDECTELAEKLNLKQANAKEKKISPNSTLIIKKYYKTCNHTIQTSEQITDEGLINLTEEEFTEKYKGWEIKEFKPEKIIIYKEIDDFCNEHYLLKEKNGYIAIYKLDKDNKETLEKLTDITVEYLPQKDAEEIKNGIRVYTKAELNRTIQDFE